MSSSCLLTFQPPYGLKMVPRLYLLVILGTIDLLQYIIVYPIHIQPCIHEYWPSCLLPLIYSYLFRPILNNAWTDCSQILTSSSWLFISIFQITTILQISLHIISKNTPVFLFYTPWFYQFYTQQCYFYVLKPRTQKLTKILPKHPTSTNIPPASILNSYLLYPLLFYHLSLFLFPHPSYFYLPIHPPCFHLSPSYFPPST